MIHHNNERLTSDLISQKIGVPLTTIQSRRSRLEKEFFEKKVLRSYKPFATSLSNLAFTVGVDIPVSRETWRKDLRPSLNSDFKIDTSKLSSSMGNVMNSWSR
jgi:hypothetical protein